MKHLDQLLELSNKIKDDLAKTMSVGHAMGPPTNLVGGAAAAGIEATHPAYQGLEHSPAVKKLSYLRMKLAESKGQNLDEQVNKSEDKDPSPKKGQNGVKHVASIAVFNHDGDLLMGKRRNNGRWTMPGGHIDAGEHPFYGAQRELKEESGLDLPHLELLGSEQVNCQDGQDRMIHAFKTQVPKGSKTTVRFDPDMEVDRWRWMDVSNGLPDHVANNLHSPKNVTLKKLGLQKEAAHAATPESLTKSDKEVCSNCGESRPTNLLHSYEHPEKGKVSFCSGCVEGGDFFIRRKGYHKTHTPTPREKSDEEKFVSHHNTGHISSESYKDINLDWIKPEKYQVHHSSMTTSAGHHIEFRQSGEPLKYVKTNHEGEIERGTDGNANYLSDQEIQQKGLPAKSTHIVAFHDNKPIGHASDEFGTDGVWVKPEYQKQGIGTELLHHFRSQFKNRGKMGQMTDAGRNLTGSYYRKYIAPMKKTEVNEPLMKPYESESQRRWAHTEAGKEALGGEKVVEHWDEATRGKKLPEKKLSVDEIRKKRQAKEKLKKVAPTPEMKQALDTDPKLLEHTKNLVAAQKPKVASYPEIKPEKQIKKAKVDEGKTPEEKRAIRSERKGSWERENYGVHTQTGVNLGDKDTAKFLLGAKLKQLKGMVKPDLEKSEGGDDIIHKNPVYRGLNLEPTLSGNKKIKFDPNKSTESSGFYGKGTYVSHTPDEAATWGNHISEYHPTKSLRLWKEPKSHRGVNIPRKDYMKNLPEHYDGISFGSGAEGGRQILLRDTNSIKRMGKVK
jgi:8-oxo-dGTP pyrophosphatase MutT (NUDIX family)/GNAT superfamily N-acetyltransferase